MSDMRLRSIRFKDGYSLDSLTNALSGQGTRADWRTANSYTHRRLTAHEIAAAYEGSGMMAKIIDIPALDKVREWRNWQAEADQITALEKEEKRLRLRQKVRLAEVYRGLGGGALILGLPGAPSSPAPPVVAAGKLAYVMVVSRYRLSHGPIIDDLASLDCGKPEWFEMATTRGVQRIHPSRVIMFPGDPVADLMFATDDDRLWGRSRIERVLEAVQNSDSANGAFAGLVAKVRNVIIGIPGLMDIVSEPDGEAALQKRLAALMLGESLYNATLKDNGDGREGSGETIDHRQVNWSGIPDVMMAFATFLSALSDIPATRLLGKSPDGQNSTGKSDDANWNKMVRASQELELGPCMDEIDRYLIQSALGSQPEDVYYEWAPLDVPSEKERADTFKVWVDAAEKVQMTGAIPDEAYAKAYQNGLVEAGWMPGLEGALADIPESERFGMGPDDGGDDDDPSALQAESEVVQGLAGSGGSGSRPARRANDDLPDFDAG